MLLKVDDIMFFGRREQGSQDPLIRRDRATSGHMAVVCMLQIVGLPTADINCVVMHYLCQLTVGMGI